MKVIYFTVCNVALSAGHSNATSGGTVAPTLLILREAKTAAFILRQTKLEVHVGPKESPRSAAVRLLKTFVIIRTSPSKISTVCISILSRLCDSDTVI